MSPPASSSGAGLLTRVVGGLRSAWFGPSVPLSPEALIGVPEQWTPEQIRGIR